jgi:hypothetical protein
LEFEFLWKSRWHGPCMGPSFLVRLLSSTSNFPDYQPPSPIRLLPASHCFSLAKTVTLDVQSFSYALPHNRRPDMLRSPAI